MQMSSPSAEAPKMERRDSVQMQIITDRKSCESKSNMLDIANNALPPKGVSIQLSSTCSSTTQHCFPVCGNNTPRVDDGSLWLSRMLYFCVRLFLNSSLDYAEEEHLCGPQPPLGVCVWVISKLRSSSFHWRWNWRIYCGLLYSSWRRQKLAVCAPCSVVSCRSSISRGLDHPWRQIARRPPAAIRARYTCMWWWLSAHQRKHRHHHHLHQHHFHMVLLGSVDMCASDEYDQDVNPANWKKDMGWIGYYETKLWFVTDRCTIFVWDITKLVSD